MSKLCFAVETGVDMSGSSYCAVTLQIIKLALGKIPIKCQEVKLANPSKQLIHQNKREDGKNLLYIL
ncbi:hypothetical protein EYC80_005274 [Monilinia laxa]|uniref:Uncharacterized protein n=1 Tax=Monilinia laxa TaxID=61186 RepID=A0A5N6KJZ4_MONLA|nr:hypothetical protein EYC80_005274 [Monilinia laxa]